MTEDEFFGRKRPVKPIAQQVREALRACADGGTDPHERMAFRELTEAITDEGAALLRRFLI